MISEQRIVVNKLRFPKTLIFTWLAPISVLLGAGWFVHAIGTREQPQRKKPPVRTSVPVEVVQAKPHTGQLGITTHGVVIPYCVFVFTYYRNARALREVLADHCCDFSSEKPFALSEAECRQRLAEICDDQPSENGTRFEPIGEKHCDSKQQTHRRKRRRACFER